MGIVDNDPVNSSRRRAVFQPRGPSSCHPGPADVLEAKPASSGSGRGAFRYPPCADLLAQDGVNTPSRLPGVLAYASCHEKQAAHSGKEFKRRATSKAALILPPAPSSHSVGGTPAAPCLQDHETVRQGQERPLVELSSFPVQLLKSGEAEAFSRARRSGIGRRPLPSSSFT
jgi:hypothetical protein